MTTQNEELEQSPERKDLAARILEVEWLAAHRDPDLLDQFFDRWLDDLHAQLKGTSDLLSRITKLPSMEMDDHTYMESPDRISNPVRARNALRKQIMDEIKREIEK